MNQPGTSWLVSAPSVNRLRENCFENDAGILRAIGSGNIEHYKPASLEIRLNNRSRITGIPAGAWLGRLSGLSGGYFFNGAWLDDLDSPEYTDGAWQAIQNALEPGEGRRIIACADISDNSSPLVKELLAREGVDVRVARLPC
jgi:hypothetical protein